MSGQCEDERRGQRGQLFEQSGLSMAPLPPECFTQQEYNLNGSDAKLDIMIALLTMAWVCIPNNVCLHVSTYTTESLINSIQSVSTK